MLAFNDPCRIDQVIVKRNFLDWDFIEETKQCKFRIFFALQFTQLIKNLYQDGHQNMNLNLIFFSSLDD
jgi:hypothetical protein